MFAVVILGMRGFGKDVAPHVIIANVCHAIISYTYPVWGGAWYNSWHETGYCQMKSGKRQCGCQRRLFK